MFFQKVERDEAVFAPCHGTIFQPVAIKADKEKSCFRFFIHSGHAAEWKFIAGGSLFGLSGDSL